MSRFLTADWNNLINITYAVAPEKLMPWLPEGLQLDTKNGSAFLSLVAFDFKNIRLKGIKIPFHHSFPEINMRFYVKQNNRRGVVFIKEFVPKYLVAFVARQVFNEPYKAIRMHMKTEKDKGQRIIEHHFRINRERFSIQVNAEEKSWLPDQDSEEHFFKEHDIGFGRDKKGRTLSYEVQHPLWEIHRVNSCRLNIDFEKIYGAHWSFLNGENPYQVLFAKGSPIIVNAKRLAP
jgi:uncharacterized protein